ncbi:FAD-binding oxidoreductase [Novosphingobium sp. 9U]|uniref:NAD(P)/FAD-dependent oxidoreductase n=1 Tax=Novosphingobium sp. 9U TaxID=2653158 RepID=UPI0012F380F8|nr:FAD-dependent oxidoreductase [Novosphingobium sp. 9U]VWX53994.1 FAD dependent oxidoreductase [Novosphingobium sp. 9U]
MTDQVDRRSLIKGIGLAGATVAIASTARAKAPSIGRNLPDVVVVGAGAFGGWTALELRERGAKVTLVDLYGPGNPRASSGDESRLIRASYGEREIYTRMAVRASQLWHQRQEEFGRNMIYINGSLRQLKPEAVAAQEVIFKKLGLPYELLGPDEIKYRWPQLNYDDVPQLFFEQKSGIVKARESMIGVSEMFQKKGGKIQIGHAKPGTAGSGSLRDVAVDGQALAAGRFVFACGPWLPKLLPSLLGDKILTPRREMFYVGSPPDDRRYRWEHCPNLSDADTYTAADVDYGIKVAGKMPNMKVDPDTQDRLVSAFQGEAVERYVAKRMPGLKGQPIVASRVCQTEYSDNGHYIIDTHPEYANVLIAGGGSGHAFKMGPALGEYVAGRVLGDAGDPQAAALFAIGAHGPANGSPAE